MDAVRRALVLALVGLAPAVLAAQQDTTGGQRDPTARSDTVHAEPVAPAVQLPIADPDVPSSPLVTGTRITLTRDSLLWTSAVTLGDVLAAIPGVYVARTGFWGQPEYVQYGGRGAPALEVFWDGMPYEPLGVDSVAVDAAEVPLTYLRRIDIEVLPAKLRVYLVSERHENSTPRSKVRVVSGAFDTGAYAGLFQRRWRSGLGLDLAADFLGTQGAQGTGARTNQAFDVWAKISWVPHPGTGMSYQLRRQHRERPAQEAGAGPGVPQVKGTRSDFLFSVFTGSDQRHRGPQLAAGLSVSRWVSDSGFAGAPDQDLRQAFGSVALRGRRSSARLEARLADRRTPLGVTGTVGWVPLRGVTLSGDAWWRQHEGERHSYALHGAAGVVAGPFSLTGEVALEDAVRAPALLADTAVRSLDRALRVGLTMKPLSGTVALVRRDAFAAPAYPGLPAIPSLPTVPAATFLETSVRVHTSSALSFGVWYADPLNGTVAVPLAPPKHARADITLHSKFWRTFRSGAFDLMVQLSMESWSTGLAGLDANDVPILLPGATFYHAFLQFQIVDFTGFWDFRNARLSQASYVPGLTYPRQAQTFGVTWEFFN